MDGKALAGIGLLLLLVVAAANSSGTKKHSAKARTNSQHVSPDGWVCDKNGCRFVGLYFCPMCSEVKSQTPGQCPKCHMDLLPTRTRGVQGTINVRAPGTRVTIPVSPMPDSHRIQQLDQYYHSAAQPAVDLPPDERKHNWRAPNGSCVHATAISLLRWPGDPVLTSIADSWADQYGGGESSGGMRRKIEAANLRYVMTVDGDVELLKWAIATRRGCGIAYGGHCIAVVGYSAETNEAILLDNNKTKEYKRLGWDEMINRWQGSRNGGWAFAFCYDPPAPIPNATLFSTRQRLFQSVM